jgi:hypothetical protein
MAPHPTDHDWRCIAEQASKETDPEKLVLLVKRLCNALDRERGRKYHSQQLPDNEPGSFPDVA